MKQPRKQVYFSKSSIDKDLLEFIEMQSNLSKSITLGMQILFEIFGKIDLKDFIPVGFEAHDTPITYEKLMKLADKNLAHNNGLGHSTNKLGKANGIGVSQPMANFEQNSTDLILALLSDPNALNTIKLLLNQGVNNTNQSPEVPNALNDEQLSGTGTPLVLTSPNSTDATDNNNLKENEDENAMGAIQKGNENEAESMKEDKAETSNEGETAWSGIEDFDM